MENLLNSEQLALLKETRNTLSELRDTLASTNIEDAERTALADSIQQLDELFLLVIAGEFNAGKSTFINALIGQTLLKEGVTPTTSQIHLLKYGDEMAQMPYRRGIWLHTAPIPLLRNVNIVDTPGTNAINREHEAITAEFIPRSDLVLFLTSADRPFTESERTFLQQIRDWGKKIVFVINKIDIIPVPESRTEIVEFVRQAAQELIGEAPVVFPVSAYQAQQAKGGTPRFWEPSGFQALEDYIHATLEDDSRFQLKLRNPLGVGSALAAKQLVSIRADLDSLTEDTQLLRDIESQTTYYNEDMQRNFESRLSEINNLIYEMERRGNTYFDEMFRLSRMPDLVRKQRMEQEYKTVVVSDTPEKIDRRVSELIDWMVEQDLRQWTAVVEHLAQRKEINQSRIVGQGGPREGTLAYDRQRLIDSIGKTAQQAVLTYDKHVESQKLADSARSAVTNTALLGLSGVGVGVGTAAAMATAATFIDVTGIFASLTLLTFGVLVLPKRKREARKELETKLTELREQLMSSLTEQFGREMRRGSQRIDDTVAPFARFVRAERDKYEGQQEQLSALQISIDALLAQLDA